MYDQIGKVVKLNSNKEKEKKGDPSTLPRPRIEKRSTASKIEV